MNRFVLVGAVSFLVIGAGSVEADTVFQGHFNNGQVFTLAHLATDGAVNPTGNWLQRPSGAIIFRVDDQTPLEFRLEDPDANGLDQADVVRLETTAVPIFDIPSGTGVGSIEFSNGFFTVGQPWPISGGEHQFTLGGSIDFLVSFTGATSAGGFQANERIEGTLYFQAFHIGMGVFNGIGGDHGDLNFILWGDVRAQGEGPSGTYYGSSGNVLSTTFSYGMDLNVIGTPVLPNSSPSVVPEPASIAVWCICLIILIVGLRSFVALSPSQDSLADRPTLKAQPVRGEGRQHDCPELRQ